MSNIISCRTIRLPATTTHTASAARRMKPRFTKSQTEELLRQGPSLELTKRVAPFLSRDELAFCISREGIERPRKPNGFIYFILGRTTRKIKIGQTENLEQRMTALQTHSPDVLELMGFMKAGSLCGTMESVIQNHFSETCSHGEWFNVTDELVLFISECADPPPFRTAFEISPLTAPFLGLNCRGKEIARAKHPRANPSRNPQTRTDAVPNC